MSDIEFIPGLIFKAPNANAPDYVKAKLSIRPAELIAYLQAQTGEWVNADVKEAKSGKWYAARDNWKPESKREDAPKGGGHGRPAPNPNGSGGSEPDDDIPFATNRGMY